MDRNRQCNNPTPANGGASCNGSFTETMNCTQPSCLAASSHRFASYSKSDVVINTCDPSTFLETIFVSRKMDCAQACTENISCKRYFYCKLDSSCRLYQDGKDCAMSGDTTGCSCYIKNIGCENSGCTCPLGYYGDRCQDTITDCTEGFQKGLNSTNDVLTNIKPVTSPNSFEVLCTFVDGGWTGILNRNKYCSSENFNRTLAEYEEGFGNVASNKWLGLQNVLYLLDNPNSTYTLGVHLYKSNASMCISNYYNFTIGNKSTSYKLDIGGYTDVEIPCGDSLTGFINLNNNPFSTYDADDTGDLECPKRFGGGWWYGSHFGCTSGFLTGTMDGSGIDNYWNENMSDVSLTQIYLKLLRN
ncbi:angiopoietin-related protein 7 [Patella vulgata]|uniref:angiopoietin-related protein 7 n=1 Tax=Patella vulgata TaxID=6465 RepID=UPI0024A9D795|nr:angiopoietin-related protein 7 [Patella vulgata]